MPKMEMQIRPVGQVKKDGVYMSNFTRIDSNLTNGLSVVIHHNWLDELAKQLDRVLKHGLDELLEKVPRERAREFRYDWQAEGSLRDLECGEREIHIVSDQYSGQLLCVTRDRSWSMRWVSVSRLLDALSLRSLMLPNTVQCPDCGEVGAWTKHTGSLVPGLYICPECSSLCTLGEWDTTLPHTRPVLLQKVA